MLFTKDLVEKAKFSLKNLSDTQRRSILYIGELASASSSVGELTIIRKKHPLQWVGNLFKINLFLVCRNLVESAKAPVIKQLLHSEWKPMCKYLCHSFCHW